MEANRIGTGEDEIIKRCSDTQTYGPETHYWEWAVESGEDEEVSWESDTESGVEYGGWGWYVLMRR